jgi:hypothetical protein
VGQNKRDQAYGGFGFQVIAFERARRADQRGFAQKRFAFSWRGGPEQFTPLQRTFQRLRFAAELGGNGVQRIVVDVKIARAVRIAIGEAGGSEWVCHGAECAPGRVPVDLGGAFAGIGAGSAPGCADVSSGMAPVCASIFKSDAAATCADLLAQPFECRFIFSTKWRRLRCAH